VHVSYEGGKAVEMRRRDCVGLTVPRFACCLISRLPPSRTRDPRIIAIQCQATERFLRACGVRPPDVRDVLRVLDS